MTKGESSPKYDIGEKILCFHGPLLYEAKCLNNKLNGSDYLYLVHYQGWSKNWDEWVTDKRMYKYDKVGLKKQAELDKMIKSGKKVKVLRKAELQKHSYPITVKKEKEEDSQESLTDFKDNTSEAKDKTDKTKPIPKPQNNKKRKLRGPDANNEVESILKKSELKLNLNPNMKAWLVDDWDLVTRQARLHELPAKKTVSMFLREFLTNASIKQEKDDDIIDSPGSTVNQALCHDLRTECAAGVQLYFDTVLGSHLLYKFERLQYGEIYKQNPDKKLSDIYGPMHLLRLFVKMRDLVGNMKIDSSSLEVLSKYLNEILDYLSDKEEEYINLKNYTIATAEYQRRAMC